MKFSRGYWICYALRRRVHHFLSECVEWNALMARREILLIAGITEDVIALLAETSRTSPLSILYNDRLAMRAGVTGFFVQALGGFRGQALRHHELRGEPRRAAIVDEILAFGACDRSHVST